MSKKSKNFIPLLIILLVFVFLYLLSLWGHQVKRNDGTVVGNTAGNLYNKGLFCELDGIVYFANAYDGYALYSMNSDETNMKKLKSSVSSYLNADENYLYCYQQGSSASSGMAMLGNTRGLYRLTHNGRNFSCVDRTDTSMLLLFGNELYYENYDDETFSTLKRCGIDGKAKQSLSDYPLTAACVSNGQIYLNGTKENHYLYTLNPSTGDLDLVLQHNLWDPIVDGDYVYFMDLESNYHLCRYCFSTDTMEILTKDRVDFYNLYGDMIYYQTAGKSPSLMRMHIDGSGAEQVAEGAFTNINITSNYVYFNEFNTPVPVYKTSTFGPVSVTTFDAAMNAAFSNQK